MSVNRGTWEAKEFQIKTTLIYDSVCIKGQDFAVGILLKGKLGNGKDNAAVKGRKEKISE